MTSSLVPRPFALIASALIIADDLGTRLGDQKNDYVIIVNIMHAVLGQVQCGGDNHKIGAL